MARHWFRALFTRPTTRSARKALQRTRLGVEAFEERLVPTVSGALTNMVVWLQADGTATDALGTSHGQLIDGVGFAAGVSGQSFALDGVNDYVRVPFATAMQYSAGFAADAWINPASLPVQGVKTGGWDIFNQSTEAGQPEADYFGMRLMYDGSVQCGIHTSVGSWWKDVRSPAGVVVPGSFTHVAVSFDPVIGELAVFVNGVKTSLSVAGSMNATHTTDLKIGSDKYNNTYFQGKIDEVGLYSRPLTASEVSTIVANGGPTKSAMTATTTTATGGTFSYDGTPHAGSGSVNVPGGVVTLSYVGINGTVYSSTTAPTNVGTYTVTATYAGDATRYGSTGSAPLTITPKLLQATAWSQGTINIGSNGSINLHLALAAGQLYGTDTVASLFNGATFTMAIQKSDGSVTYGTLTSTAHVESDGSITVSMPMNDALRADLYDAYLNCRAVNFNMTATSNGGNYFIDEDTMSRLLNNGANRYIP